MFRRAAFALLVLLSATLSAFAQSPYPPGPPPAVPALPDSQRQITYSISGTTCACDVGFQLYGTSTDYYSWVEVWLNGVNVAYNDPVYGWSLSSPTGNFSLIPRPITDAVLTFNNVQTGTVVIVGAERPRRTAEFAENQGVPARALNQTFNDLYAIAREFWDKTNDLTGRALISQPGNVLGMLPLPSACENSYLTFDSTGLNPICLPLQTGSVAQLSVGQSTLLNGTNGCQLYDNNGILGCQTFANALSVGTTTVQNGTNGCALYDDNGTLGCTNSSVSRIKLTAATSFYVDPVNGTNQSGCGLSSGSSACATIQYLVNILYAGYDTGAQTVTVNLAHGTYTAGASLSGPLVGQAGAGSLIFTGDCSTSATVFDAIIQPTSQGNSYAFSYGAMGTIQCQYIDHSKELSVSAGADMVEIGQGARVVLGDSSLFGSYADLKYGCNINPWNLVTNAFQGYFEVVNDFDIDETNCKVTTTATLSDSSSTLTSVASTAGVVDYMSVVGTDIPTDAFVESFTSDSITLGCFYTSPCEPSGNGSGVSISMYGGGQDAFDFGNAAQAYFNTNGDPSYSIVVTMATPMSFYSGFMYVNDLSGANAGALTFVNYGENGGQCPQILALSSFDSYRLGSPYLPCFGGAPYASTTASSVSSGASSITVASATGFKVGSVISDVYDPTASWSAGSQTITVSGTNATVADGAFVSGAGILSGATVTNVASDTISLGGCGAGPRCVSGYPTYLAETGATVIFHNYCIAAGTYITAISSDTLSLSQPVAENCSSINIWATATVYTGAIYQ